MLFNKVRIPIICHNMKQISVCNISDFTSVILKSFLFRHKMRKCICTHSRSHLCTYKDVADIKMQCVCVHVCACFRGCLALCLPSNTTPSISGNFERLLERDVGSILWWWSAHSDKLIHSLTGRLLAPTVSGSGRSSKAWDVGPSKSKNLRPTGFIWAHQVNSCFPEHRQLSFSLCQEPLETLYEDN